MAKVDIDSQRFTPETLGYYAKLVEDLRADCLLNTDDAGADPFAEQHFLTALAHLELAHRHFTLAKLSQQYSAKIPIKKT